MKSETWVLCSYARLTAGREAMGDTDHFDGYVDPTAGKKKVSKFDFFQKTRHPKVKGLERLTNRAS